MHTDQVSMYWEPGSGWWWELHFRARGRIGNVRKGCRGAAHLRAWRTAVRMLRKQLKKAEAVVALLEAREDDPA